MSFKLTYQSYGKQAILISWPQKIDISILKDIQVVITIIGEIEGEELQEIVNGYQSILVLYKTSIDMEVKCALLKAIVSSSKQKQLIVQNKKWDIPVCYEPNFGLDIESLSVKKRMNMQQLISLHTQNVYTVYCKGFLPGFLYLGGLNKKLYTQRKAIPRTRIPKNAVAIGGRQTGIYPFESPGGWYIIGNTPISICDIYSESISPFQVGDTIQFYEIDKQEYDRLYSKQISFAANESS